MTPEEFLSAMAETATAHNLGAHMNLISKDVKVFGIPKHEVITYDDWFNQCKQEFEDKLLLSISYQDLHITSENADQIRFIATESVEATDGHKNTHRIEFIVAKEEDEQWRVVCERIMPEAELDDDKKITLQ